MLMEIATSNTTRYQNQSGGGVGYCRFVCLVPRSGHSLPLPGSLGIPRVTWLEKLGLQAKSMKELTFGDTIVSDCVENAFQALALDEHRAAFSPAVWEKSPTNKTVSPDFRCGLVVAHEILVPPTGLVPWRPFERRRWIRRCRHR
jgi:hypothetical protein